MAKECSENRDSLDSLRLLTPAETARILNVSPSHLHNMRDMPDHGGLPVVNVGSSRTPRYSMDAVLSFIENGGTSARRDVF